jgi:hypothetical protein
MPIALLFTGHMTDLPERDTPRFPPRLESAARAAIAAKIDVLKSAAETRGFASGARGGDILFHEECRSRGIATEVVLPFAPEEFIDTSVDDKRGPHWASRFWKLWNGTPTEQRAVLGLSPTDDEAYALCNTELRKRAQAYGLVRLIALWDEKPGGGAGGTEHMVGEVKKMHQSALAIINPSHL